MATSIDVNRGISVGRLVVLAIAHGPGRPDRDRLDPLASDADRGMGLLEGRAHLV